ncbi:YfhO family protein [Archangium sp.]|uniref:YfhO family protein n=1 Tax=Archangium sp. TaxID=1872627 RepID=UPI002D4D96F3|nr:YfhO family protein [Archangium sp.]HYO60092.1 YfhO family protein [Archangium sp.]
MPLSQQTRTRLAVVATVFSLPFLYFHRAAFTDEIFIARDILRVYYPLKQYWAERVSQFQFPDWYPYDGLGQPYAGMLISGAFHPANLLYLLLPLGTALKAITLLSYVAALGGTWLFARLWGLGCGAALLAGLTYGLGGYMVGISNNLLYLMAAATFPWALWGAERFLRQPSAGRAAAAAIPLCLVLFSGDPQSFAMCNGMLLVLVLLRPDRAGALRAAPRAGLLIVLGALLSAVQILSIFSTLKNAHPSAPNLLVATRFSFHPLRLVELVLGPIFTHPETGMVASGKMAQQLFQSPLGTFWVYSVYMGLPALLLLGGALWAWRRNPLTWKVTGLALFILALSMARNLPLYGWFYDHVPLWSSFRYPEKLLPYFLFPAALGAGAGLEAVLRDSALARRLAQAGFVLAGVCGLLALSEWRLRIFSGGVISALWENAETSTLELLHGNFIQAAGVGAVTLGLMGVVLTRTHQPVPRAVAILGLQLAVLYLANESTYHVTYRDVLEQPTGLVNAILNDATETVAGRPRVYGGVDDLLPRNVPEGLESLDILSLNIAAALEPDTPALWHLESARPYLPAVSRRVATLMELDHALDRWMSRLAGLFHVRYITVESETFVKNSGNRKVVLAEDPRLGAVLLRNPRTLPRAYLATPRCVPDPSAALGLILSRDLRPGLDVALECPPGEARGEAPADTGEPGQVRFIHYAPESVELEVEARQPAVLVLNDAFYDGWSATVDGQPAPILPANLAVRGVHVPAGTHQVSFTYRTPFLRLGALISLGSLSLLGLAVLLERRKRVHAS